MPKPRAKHSLEQIDCLLAVRSLREFTRLFWPVLEPSTPYVPGWHLDAISDHLEAVTAGQVRNLLVNIPPRHCKSLSVSVFWMVWSWLTKPQTRWLYSSYALSLSIRDSLKCRRLIESPAFQNRFGDRFRLTGDQNAKMRFDNDKTGYRIATSVGGAATGEGGDVVVVDDPHSVQEKESEAVRESTLVWWDETMSTRLNDQKTGAKVIVMQRVHEKDLSGHVLKQGGYVHLCLPAEYVPSRHCVTSIGWQDPRTKEGELLWPQRVGEPELRELKIRLGANGYAGQFGQTPTAAGGGRFKQSWFRYFRRESNGYVLLNHDGQSRFVAADDCYTAFAVMDPAGTDRSVNDKACYTAILSVIVTPTWDMLVDDVYREQVETPQAVEDAIVFSRRNRVEYIAVEKDGIGLGVVQTIRRRGTTVKPIKARGSKEARSETAEIRMEAGMVYFREDVPNRFAMESELLLFPNGEHCDTVDALSHGARIVHRMGGAPVGTGDGEWQEAQAAAAEQHDADAAHPGHDIPSAAVTRAADGDADVPEFIRLRRAGH